MMTINRGVVTALLLLGALGIVGSHVADAQDKKDKPKPVSTTAVFELYKDRGGEFRFRLKDSEGTLLAISGKGYDKKADCQKVIDSIKQYAAKAKVEDDTK
jgi:uncharacterized protein YegP (UPF0339 family)